LMAGMDRGHFAHHGRSRFFGLAEKFLSSVQLSGAITMSVET